MSLNLPFYLVLLTSLVNIESAQKNVYEVIDVKIVQIDAKYIEQNITMNRVKRGVFSFDIHTTFLVEVPSSSEIEVTLHRSAYGNNQYTPSPVKIPRSKLEEFMNQYYKKYLMDDVSKFSSFPLFEGDWSGPFPKGYYWVKNYIFNSANLADANLSPGQYKATAYLYRDGQVIYKGEGIMKITLK